MTVKSPNEVPEQTPNKEPIREFNIDIIIGYDIYDK